VSASPERAGDGRASPTASAAIGGLPGSAREPLRAAGLDVLGALAVADYDTRVPPGWRSGALLPGARSILVIGSGGSRLARAALDRGGPDPVETLAGLAVARCVDALVVAGHRAVAAHAFERRDERGRPRRDAGAFADFVALGEAAGLGARSRLRLLVHPVYGPWLAVRSIVVTTARLSSTRPDPGFAPCEDCAAPCRDACPAEALATGPLDTALCLAERRAGGACALHCAARHACVLGREHAQPPDLETHFMRSSLRILP
jgi:epoxyqueuosine reductase QueG